ncbi:MAG: phosphatidylserine decarboxylase family protein [Bacteroidales bacterium]|nr:phosphatidylserine decarboxylase family protein [Candidatus Liminaster caballi]
MKTKKMHKEGTATILAFGAVVVIAIVVLAVCNAPTLLFVAVLTPLLILYGITINFFRYPARTFTGDRLHDVIAPSDGTIVTIEEVFEPDYFKDKRIQISIFMSLTNVHAQWCPLNGDILKVEHEDGNFKKANLPKSSTENERSTIVIKSDAGPVILMRQVAGAVARRIVTYIQAGERSEINGELGFIKFGSRIDLYLPLDAEILVKIGDTVKGNTTPVAKI